MEENPSRIRRKRRRNQPEKHRQAAEDGGSRETKIECSGRSCRSCTGGAVADCVALCCCPCSVVSLLALAFVKVPWMVGRRWLGRGKIKGRKQESRIRCRKVEKVDSLIMERNGNARWHGKFGVVSPDYAEKFDGSSSSSSLGKLESEMVWWEVFEQVEHLGFGRVSFTGERSLGKESS